MEFEKDGRHDELRSHRNNYVNLRWAQLYGLSKEASESALKYLFLTNAGGAVAVLAYLGSVSASQIPAISAKVALVIFFVGLLFVGLYKAYMVHDRESLFVNYKFIVNEYYEGRISWQELLEADEKKVGNAKAPYIMGYAAFLCFVIGCGTGARGIL